MKDKIEVYNTSTGEVITDRWEYFIFEGMVFKDNGEVYESQQSCISFEDFIVECPHLSWRVIST